MDAFWGNCFYGTPLQNFGEINAAIFAGTSAELLKLVQAALAKGDVAERLTTEVAGGRATLVEFPAHGAARFGVLFFSDRSMAPAIIGVYPILEGMANSLVLLNHKAWDNGLMGMVACETAAAGSLGFFDPFYFSDFPKLKRGQRLEFSLSAVAYTCAIASNEEVELTHGQIYEDYLAEFLAMYPGTTRADFPSLRVILGSMQMLFPTENTGDYHYRGLVLAKESVELAGAPLARFQLCIGIDGRDRAPEFWLYAAPQAISERDPRPGDYIEGYCAVFGQLC